MAVHVPVVRKYRIGDHVGLESIMAVGEVVRRRGVVTGLGHDDGSGRYLVTYDGVPERVHEELLISFCLCPAHAKFWRKMQRRAKREGFPTALSQLLPEVQRDCESTFSPKNSGLGTSAIWYQSSDLLNCCGKERLPLNVNVTYGTPPPFFPLTPMGGWNPAAAPRYARSMNLG